MKTEKEWFPDFEGAELYECSDDPMETELDVVYFISGFVQLLKPKLVIETGCYRGEASMNLYTGICEFPGSTLIVCDTDKEKVEEVQKLFANFPLAEVRHCRGDQLPELRECDFLYCDSGADDRDKEIAMVKDGCMVVAHDARRLEVRTAMEKYCPGYMFIPTPRGLAFGFRG